MKRKTAMILVLTLLLILGICPQVAATETQVLQNPRGTITPLYVYTYEPIVFLGFSGNTAECDAYISVKTGVTKVSATLKLERKNANGTYTLISSWTNINSGGDLDMSESRTVTEGYTYRLTVTAKVYNGSAYETVSISTSSYC